MGWTSMHGVTRQQMLTNELRGMDIQKIAWRGNVAYVAVRMPQGVTIGVVALVNGRSGGDVAIKTMTEDMGPAQSNCPATVLAALTPIDEIRATTGWSMEYAEGWRNRCQQSLDRAAQARQVKPGTTVTFTAPLSFGSGIGQHSRLTLVKQSIFRTPTGALVRVPSWRTRYEWTVEG